ncbi:MAG TPA: hypothetical protein PLU30_13855 [Verrucomicrobiae bacterium]|nr:hypothetical protein [Verrucomicrobiae bacterium]
MTARSLLGIGLVTLLGATANAIADGWQPGVWAEPSLEPRAAADAGAVREALVGAGFKPVMLRTSDLIDPAKLDPARLSFLVLPYGACYPAAGFEALDRYLRRGGACVTLGERRFRDLLFSVEGRWVPMDSAQANPAWPRDRVAWDLSMHGDGGPLQVSGEGATNSPFCFTSSDLRSYQYAGLKPGPLPAGGAVLAFEARSDDATPFLCLEFQENDGSRWKRIIELSTAWREYRLHTAGFVSYATKDRAADHFHPAQAKSLSLGLFKQIGGAGPHRFEVRNMSIRQADVPSVVIRAAGVPLDGRELAHRFLGKEVPPPPAKRWPDPFREGTRFTRATLKCASDHFLVTGSGNPSGAFDGRVLTQGPPPHDTAKKPVLLFPRATSSPRFVPLLEAFGPDHNALGPVAGLVMDRAGRHSGSAWAIFALDRFDMGQEPLRALFLKIARFLDEGVTAEPTSPVFPVRPEGARAVLAQSMRNRSPRDVTIHLRNTLSESGAQPTDSAMELTVPRGTTSCPAWHDVPIDSFDWLAFRTQSDIGVGDRPLARVTLGVDVRQALRDLADFLVAQGRDDGKFSGTHYFVDHRGARTLLAAHAIFGDRRYLDTAFAWARAMVSEQRDDGGYRMGYGITSKGESCFVADGGEIALGVARVAASADGADRQRFMDSLRAYMGYRDSFRCPGGGIGVGWCLDDYGKRPTERLEKPTKIFAPEMNTYTIGCTLGAAYAWAALTRQPEDMDSARRDADWLMARTEKSLTGASAESYVLAHALDPDPDRRRVYGEFLRHHFIEPMAASTTSWWLGGGGRSALDLHALSYCHRRLGGDPPLLPQMARAAWAMCGKESPTSIYLLLGLPKLNHDEWIYLCFGGIGLADVVEPLASLKGLVTPP